MILNSSLAVGDAIQIKPNCSAEEFVRYASKTRVSQAAWLGGINMRPRLKGSFELGEHGNRPHIGGGDRDYLSRALKDEMQARGRWKDYKRTYAPRILNAPKKPLEAHSEALTVFSMSECPPLFDNLPEATGRRGKGVSTPNPRLKINHGAQLPLNFAPDIRSLLRLVGTTDQEIAQKIGASRPQITNIRNGQFGASKNLVRKVLELVKAAA